MESWVRKEEEERKGRGEDRIKEEKGGKRIRGQERSGARLGR